MGRTTVEYSLSNTLAKWPYPRRLNPHYEVVKDEASAWLEGFNALSSKAQSAFNRCDFNLCAALAFPTVSEERLRTSCDLMNLFFLYDEYSDRESVEGMTRLSAEIMHALRNPHDARKDNEYVVAEIFRQFWERAIKSGNPIAHQRFVDAFDEHTAAMVEEAHDRSTQRIRDIEDYLQVRRGTIGTMPAFQIRVFDLDLPGDILDHPVIRDLEAAATDMIIIGNDIYSYNIEQARGDDTQNLVTVVMHEKDIDLSAALVWIQDFHHSLAEQFLTKVKDLPAFGEHTDSQLLIYVESLGNCVRANDSWCFESQRYFGTIGLDIQDHRVVTLTRKVKLTSAIDLSAVYT